MQLAHIQDVWKPETLKRIEKEKTDIEASLAELRFSDRNAEPPPHSEAEFRGYQMELKGRTDEFLDFFLGSLNSVQFSDALSACFTSLDTVEQSAMAANNTASSRSRNGRAGTTPLDFFRSPLQALQGGLDNALDEVKKLIIGRAVSISGKLRATRDLPALRAFIQEHVEKNVLGLMKEANKQIAGIIELEQVAPLPVLAFGETKFPRIPLDGKDAVCSVEDFSCDQSESPCAICQEPLLNSGEPIYLLRTCPRAAHHFHQHCLDNHVKNKGTTCPVCRAPFKPHLFKPPARRSMTAIDLIKDDNSEVWAETKGRVLQQAKKAAAAVSYKLQALRTEGDLERQAKATAKSRHLLEETPELQTERSLLQRNLDVLRHVQRVIGGWTKNDNDL